MYLMHESTIRQPNGIIEITVGIVNESENCKKYTYRIGSEYKARRFHNLYRKSRKLHGKALAILNESNIKEDKE